MSAFGFFDKVYVIHLPNPGRRDAMQKQLERLGISGAQFLHADRPPNGFQMWNMRRCGRGEFGVNLSQIKAVVHAIADGAEHPLFLEDDVVFCEDVDRLLSAALADLPPDWSVLYLGGHPREGVTRFSASLAKVGKFSFAEAYSINRKALLGFVDRWCNRISKDSAMYDFILGEHAAAGNSFCAYPLLCEQPPNVSQVSGKLDDKRKLVAKAWRKSLGDEHVTKAHLAQSVA
jgi:hypothetical protein